MSKTIPIENQYCMTVEEAALYFKIGEKRIRQICAEHPGELFYCYNGNRLLIKRKLFEMWIDEAEAV